MRYRILRTAFGAYKNRRKTPIRIILTRGKSNKKCPRAGQGPMGDVLQWGKIQREMSYSGSYSYRKFYDVTVPRMLIKVNRTLGSHATRCFALWYNIGMDWRSLLVGFISGFICGVLAIVFETGARRMLAPTIIKRKLIIGHISKSIEGNIICWYVPIHVKASRLYNFIVSSLDDVSASIVLSERKNRYSCSWINPGTFEDSAISLRIGTERSIGIAEQFSGSNIIRPYNDYQASLSSEDEDIQLELKYGDAILGQWLFRKAIVGGIMQEVEPIKEHNA